MAQIAKMSDWNSQTIYLLFVEIGKKCMKFPELDGITKHISKKGERLLGLKIKLQHDCSILAESTYTTF